MHTAQKLALSAAASITVVAAALAQLEAPAGFDLSWNTMDGGGGQSTGGIFEVTGTIGQPDASATALGGGAFEVRGGFWPGGVVPVPTCPADVALPHNGMVDIDDLVVVITHWGQAGGQGDVTHDNTVDIDDLVQVIVHWGMCS